MAHNPSTRPGLSPLADSDGIRSPALFLRVVSAQVRIFQQPASAACLVCRGRVDLERAAAEMLEPEEHRRRVDERYAPALAGVEPAVVAFTTQVAAAAVSELLERLIHYGPSTRPFRCSSPNRLSIRCLGRRYAGV